MIPAPIDRSVRIREIRDASFRILSAHGPKALTLRRLAEELGGSSTLVTHIFGTRSALLRGITESAIEDYDEEIAQLEQGADARQRLRILLEWMLPLDEEQARAERGRIMLVGHSDRHLGVTDFSLRMEHKMRQLLRTHLRELVNDGEVEDTVEYVRVFTNGVVLSAAERPSSWSADRQQRVVDQLLRRLGIS
ncbi:TetR family transcriptional regulator [Actinoplanes lutulentus]|uniref:TetR family transcriptional regulator n=1 Tax=Actinoplanes lutulentus TaxID=1287878 RepID=A0A327Z279_9ACTN|nr:TetR family transcriptional regulator C-terminal domain-containing protein [Actinoplanes lutulentus]RAK28773.1 TetR family transcriptional regulator [Actinoplanes lutulentus]